VKKPGPVLIVIAALVAFGTGQLIRDPFADGDLFWQRRLGEYVLAHHAVPHALGPDVFSAVGAPWVAQEWLFSTVVAIAFDAGAIWTIAIISGLALFAALAIAAWRALRADAATSAVTLVAVFAAICIYPTFALRAQVWAWPLFALALLVLDAEGLTLWWLVPITVLWANLHASVMIVVPIVWLNAAIYAWTSPRNSPGVRTRLLLCIAVPLATLCTPLGIGLPLYAFELLHSPLRAYISEWQPIDSVTVYRLFGFFPLVALTLLALLQRLWDKRPFDAALSVLLAVLSFFATRNVALFAFVAMIPASLALGSARQARSLFDRLPQPAATILALLVVVPLFGWFGVRVGAFGIQWPAPFGSVQHLAAQPGEHRLFCAEYSWCSVALGEPNIRIFLDGRADPYPPRVWAAHGTITRARPGWRQLMTDYDINAVIAWRGGFFESQMQTLPQWKEITDTNDLCCVLFLKNSP
jgi:hypothetical protein